MHCFKGFHHTVSGVILPYTRRLKWFWWKNSSSWDDDPVGVWTLDLIWLVLLWKEGNLDIKTNMYREKMIWRELGRRMSVINQWKRSLKDPSFKDLRRNKSCWPMPWFWTSNLYKCEIINFPSLGPQVCGISFQQLHQTNTGTKCWNQVPGFSIDRWIVK